MKTVKLLLIFFVIVLFCFNSFNNLYNTFEPLRIIKSEQKNSEFPNDIEYIKRTFPFGTADADAHSEALKEGQTLRNESKSDNSSLNWQLAGPRNIGGRISDIEFNPNNPDVVYAGAATGGVFKSTDGGIIWNPIFDDMAVLPIGDIAIDPVNSNNIYVGTGEANGGHNNFAGAGLYKSTDAGITWRLAGLENTVSIGRIVIDPVNPLKIFVAAVGSYFGPNPDRGIFRSDNGGLNWNKVLFVSDSTGAIDIAIDPVNSNNLLAAMWQRTRYPNGGALYGKTSGIYKSTDGGNNWISLGAANGLPNSAATNVGRIGISISKSNPNIAYSLFTNGSAYLGFYKTINGGLNWTNADPGGNLQSGFSTFSWYFGNVRIQPDNPDIVYVLDFSIMKSTNSGISWDLAGFDIHVDNHALAFKPTEPNSIIVGNDGGIYNSSNGGNSFTKVSDLPITQFYEIGIDKTNPERLYGGTQDNGTNRTLTGNNNDWETIYGGDGFYVLVDPNNPDIIYAESQNGNLGKSTDGGTNFYFATSGISSSEKKNWSTPVIMDPVNSNILYYGTNRVYRTTNGASSWTAVSPDLTNGNQTRLGTVTAISVSPVNSNFVLAGTDDANVWLTTNYGVNWSKISTSLPYRWVTRVVFSPNDENTAYVTYNGLKWKDPQPHVFRTTDKGQSWNDISGNLPDAPVNAFAADPLRPQVLFVGSDVGAYYTTNTGVSWSFLGDGLPMVSVYDFKIHPTAYYLAAGTHGRSMYKIDMSEIVSINPEISSKADDFVLNQNFPNPFNPVTAINYIIGSSGKVRLIVYDVTGKEIRKLVDNINQNSGDFTVVWNGRDNYGTEMSSGIYFYSLVFTGKNNSSNINTKRMMLIK